MLLEFDKNWASIGLNDNDLRKLQEELFLIQKKVMLRKEWAVYESFDLHLKVKAKAEAFVMWILQFLRAFIFWLHILNVKRIT